MKRGNKPARGPVRPAPRASAARDRQRLRLIDACISALHIHGPSRTTVEKVVAIAKMSPGIVRFYFDSKAAMLVASLQFLAAEFEQRLLEPVAALKADPVAALERLVELYLDPEIASARKVSVWYAFWGEASSRQEYYDICGQKDDRFAALVRELIERLIIDTRRVHLDPDGVALGLIGVLEMLWQGFAFQTEVNIDRAAAKHRCMSYLRSIFPGQFALAPLHAAARERAAGAGARLPRWSFEAAAAFQLERAELFAGNHQFIGDQRTIPLPGAYLALDIGAERALVVRDENGALRAFRNSCADSPHELAPGYCGQWHGAIACAVHGHRFHYDGTPQGGSRTAPLHPLELRLTEDWIWVGGRADSSPSDFERVGPARSGGPDWYGTAALHWRGDGEGAAAAPRPAEILVCANWKVIVEQWLAAAPGWTAAEPETGPAAASLIVVRGRAVIGERWSARRYRSLLGIGADAPWQRRFIAPNQFIERRPDGVSIIQILPAAPGRSILRSFDYAFHDYAVSARALRYLARRLTPERRAAGIALAESVHQGIAAYGYDPPNAESLGPAVGAFHGWMFARIPSLGLSKAPIEPG
jgi:TetR/AcrR family transcriptional repressor of bet genes